MARENPNIHEPTETEYKGHPMLQIPIGDGYSFNFGLRKAKAVLDHIAAIEGFVINHEQEGGQ